MCQVPGARCQEQSAAVGVRQQRACLASCRVSAPGSATTSWRCMPCRSACTFSMRSDVAHTGPYPRPGDATCGEVGPNTQCFAAPLLPPACQCMGTRMHTRITQCTRTQAPHLIMHDLACQLLRQRVHSQSNMLATGALHEHIIPIRTSSGIHNKQWHIQQAVAHTTSSGAHNKQWHTQQLCQRATHTLLLILAETWATDTQDLPFDFPLE